MDFSKELDDLIDVVDLELKKGFMDKDCYQGRIMEAIDYSLFTGGKRLRPIMTLKSCEMFSKDYTDAIPYALAIEMIHTYSLIHDDLPAMDDDDFRRGKPTSHKVFGEAMAILAGDGLLNFAFEIISKHMVKNSKVINDYIRYSKAMNEVSRYSGIHGMIGGQVVDLLASHDNMTEEKLLFMYRTKTAALIQAALVSGAIIGEASDIEIDAMRDFGLYLGLAYQIRDDILDIKQDSSIKKLTYLTFNDINKAENDIKRYSNMAINTLRSLKDRDISFFIWLTEELINRNN